MSTPGERVPSIATPLGGVGTPPMGGPPMGGVASSPVGAGTRPPSVANIANALTITRLVLVPLLWWLMMTDHGTQRSWRLAATAVFVVASLTDRFDGRLARQRNLVTDFGKIADPIADKALIGAALIGLSILGQLDWWVTVVILTRELGVTALRFWVIRRGVIAASRGGKLKTALQSVAIGLYLLPLHGAITWSRAVFIALALVLTVVTGFDYLARALRLHRDVPVRRAG